MPLVRKYRPDHGAAATTNLAPAVYEQRAHGSVSSLATLTWPAGLRSTATVNSAEQILHVTSGALAAFVLTQDGGRHACPISSGGFLRIPPLAVHWLNNTTTRPAEVIRFCGPGLHAGGIIDSVALFADWEDADDSPTVPWQFDADPTRYRMSDIEAELAGGGLVACELVKAGDEVAEYSIERGFAVNLRTKMVFGTRGSVMVATRPGGYHSTPHVHDAEQLNVVTDGEIWGYIIAPDGTGHSYHLSPGDLWRVPALAVHWAWNRADEPVTLVEYHAPGLQRDPVVGKSAVSLLTNAEALEASFPAVSNLFVVTSPDVIHDAEIGDPDDAI